MYNNQYYYMDNYYTINIQDYKTLRKSTIFWENIYFSSFSCNKYSQFSNNQYNQFINYQHNQ